MAQDWFWPGFLFSLFAFGAGVLLVRMGLRESLRPAGVAGLVGAAAMLIVCSAYLLGTAKSGLTDGAVAAEEGVAEAIGWIAFAMASVVYGGRLTKLSAKLSPVIACTGLSVMMVAFRLSVIYPFVLAMLGRRV